MTKRGIELWAITLIALVSIGDQRVWSFGNELNASGCSIAVGGDLTESDVEIICGIPPKIFEKLINRYESALEDKDEILILLREKLQLNERQIEAAFEAAGSEGVSAERMGEKLLEIAQQYKNLQTKFQELSDDSAEIKQKKASASKALEEGKLDLADQILDEIIALEDASINERALEAAETRAQKAELALLRFRYRDAADAYAGAAKRVTQNQLEQKLEYLRLEAEVLYDDGYEFGRNDSLVRAIGIYREISFIISREQSPLDWARTQASLAKALSRLGERERSARRLEEAVNAYHAALEEWTRERAPTDWAKAQNGLGVTLWSLGKQERGTARFKDAVVACRAALEEHTAEKAPLERAKVLTNLGTILGSLGERERGTARLEESLAAYQAALELTSREQDPLGWGMTKANLGIALWRLGQREGGTDRLEKSVAALRESLEEQTRERVPIEWARTQYHLGVVLRSLGTLEESTARLEEAVTAFHASLEEWTRDVAPSDWAMTQYTLAGALRILGENERGTERLKAAATAYRAALELLNRDRELSVWMSAQVHLGRTTHWIGYRDADVEALREARFAYEKAWEASEEPNGITIKTDFPTILADVDQLIRALENCMRRPYPIDLMCS